MTGSTKERAERLRDIVATVSDLPDGASYPALRSLLCRSWAITSRTAAEYIDILIDGGMLAHSVPGGPLKATPVGIKWMLGDYSTDEAASQELKLVKAPQRALPSPPAQTGGFGGTDASQASGT